MYRSFFKRFLDFFGALIGLILLSPILLIVTFVLYVINNGEPFFFQQRPGKDSVIFKTVKFKTMSDKKDAQGNLLPDAMRLTNIGAFVRNNSLDELPQLFNVLKGEMSLVGPRPLLVEYLSLYDSVQKRRHQVRPGITGWAQVNGRNSISWKEKFEFDVWYIDNVSFLLDIKILLKTVFKVFKKAGIYKDGDITSMEAFNGNN